MASPLRSLYEQIRGKIHIDRFEIVEPRAQVAGDVAVLTFRFKSYGSEGSMPVCESYPHQVSPGARCARATSGLSSMPRPGLS